MFKAYLRTYYTIKVANYKAYIVLALDKHTFQVSSNYLVAIKYKGLTTYLNI